MAVQKRARRSTAVARTSKAAKYDWPALQRVFVEGEEKDDGSLVTFNLKEISDRFGVPYQRVRERASQERWTDRRNVHQQQTAVERQRKQRKKMVDESVQFDVNALNAAKLGIGMSTARLAEIMAEHQVKQARVKDAQRRMEAGEPVEKWELYSAINYRELEGLAGAIERFQSVGMRAMGTDVQKYEVTSPDGSMAATTINVTAELHRDDADRMALILEAMQDAGLIPEDAIQDIIDGEVVGEDEEVEEVEIDEESDDE